MIIVGAGGHALSLAEFASDLIEGYLANECNPKMPGKWLGNDSVAHKFVCERQKFHIAFVYSKLPRMDSRRKLIDEYKKLGCQFATLIAPSAIVTPGSTVGDGCAVMAGAIINRAQLGENCVINSGAIVEHDCKVGDNTFVGPGAVIGGFTQIGENCFIGLGAKIANGLTIGNNVTVAMGAVVNRNLTEPGIYHGNPLRLFQC